MSERIGIVGEILPGADGEPPVFKIIRDDYELSTAGPNVRPCAHGKFILDEKWATVTCGECHQHVDAFSALMHYAEWGKKWKRQRAFAEQAERSLQLAELRRLRNLRDCTPEDCKEIEAAIRDGWRIELAKLRELTRRVDRAVRAIKNARRDARRRRQKP